MGPGLGLVLSNVTLKPALSAAALAAGMCSLAPVITVLKVSPAAVVPVAVVTTETRCSPMMRGGVFSARRLMVAASIWQV